MRATPPQTGSHSPERIGSPQIEIADTALKNEMLNNQGQIAPRQAITR
ncbi:hypothetical protein ACW9FF_14395 [Ralstonia mannitolilytica]